MTTAMLEDFLRALGTRDGVQVIRYPTLNHLFIPGAGPPRPSEYNDAGTVAVEVSRDIAEWIRRVTSQPGRIS
jgi:hypothetical protein